MFNKLSAINSVFSKSAVRAVGLIGATANYVDFLSQVSNVERDVAGLFSADETKQEMSLAEKKELQLKYQLPSLSDVRIFYNKEKADIGGLCIGKVVYIPTTKEKLDFSQSFSLLHELGHYHHNDTRLKRLWTFIPPLVAPYVGLVTVCLHSINNRGKEVSLIKAGDFAQEYIGEVLADDFACQYGDFSTILSGYLMFAKYGKKTLALIDPHPLGPKRAFATAQALEARFEAQALEIIQSPSIDLQKSLQIMGLRQDLKSARRQRLEDNHRDFVHNLHLHLHE